MTTSDDQPATAACPHCGEPVTLDRAHTCGPYHECVFVEEQEPSGRLILGPCLTCGTTAMDALDQLRGALRRIMDCPNPDSVERCHDEMWTIAKEALS